MIANYTQVHTLEEIEPEDYMTVYPNPTDGRVYINTKKVPDFHIIEQMDLINERGQVLQRWENVPTKFFIDIDSHPTGTYFLKVRTNLRTEEFIIVLKE